MAHDNFLWIFNGNYRSGGELPSGVFLTKENAQKWIESLGIKGTLTPYPVDVSVYDWAIKNKFFTPEVPEHYSRAFIAKFITTYYQKYLGWVDQKIATRTKTDKLNKMIPGPPASPLTEDIKPFSEVWVFNAYASERTGLASAVFRTKRKALYWIKKKELDGLLTAYPVDISAYDWAIQNKLFTPKKPHQSEPLFKGTFTGGHKHFHYYFEPPEDS